jgi:hypothetical protein
MIFVSAIAYHPPSLPLSPADFVQKIELRCRYLACYGGFYDKIHAKAQLIDISVMVVSMIRYMLKLS